MNTQVRRGIFNAAIAMTISAMGICSTTGVFAEQSEIDVFDQALASESTEGAVRFLEAFPSSHLGGDLIELLPPDVAAQVCGSLPKRTSSATRHSCGQLIETVALTPAAGPAEAGKTIDQQPSTQPTEASPAARVVSVDDSGSGDKPHWLTNGTPEESITDASLNSRRDGLAAEDTAEEAADSPAEDTTDDSTAPSDPADAEATTSVGSHPQKAQEDGGGGSGGPGGNGSDDGGNESDGGTAGGGAGADGGGGH